MPRDTPVAAGSSIDRLGFITKVARLYHEQGLRQPEIASRLHLSQSKVSRLLTEAVAAGIVRTIVVPPEGMHTDIESQVAKAYGLSDVVVAEPVARGDQALLSAIGSAGAAYLSTVLAADDRIGISSWSSTLLAAVESMSRQPSLRAAEVVQMLGGVGDPSAQAQATHMVSRLGQVTGAQVSYLGAPGLVGSRSLRDALLHDDYISATAASWKNLTVALVGIGSLQPSALLASSGNAVSPELRDVLRASGAVGDVCLHFFDQAGVAVRSPIEDRVVGISRDALRAVPRRIGVAGGERKWEAVRAALRGGWVNVLITDVTTAEFLLGEG